MNQLNELISRINIASKANDGVLLSQLEVNLATFLPTLVEELTKARNNYANSRVKYLNTTQEIEGKTPKSMSVAEATIRADAETGCREDELKALIESANVIINSLKDQLRVYLIEKGLNQGV